MFNTADFLGAELDYRRDRLMADLEGVRRRRVPRRRTWSRRDYRSA